MEVAGAVYALDSDEFDVTGGRGTGDEGVRAGWVQPGERVGQVGGDLIGPDHHQVKVGHQGEPIRIKAPPAANATRPARRGVGPLRVSGRGRGRQKR